MDALTVIGAVSIFSAAFAIGVGVIAPSLGQGRAVSQALQAIAEQPDASATITRTLFVGLAMVESGAIYAFVVAMILIFANPFWNALVSRLALGQ